MAKSGVIGDVIDVKASLSKLMDEAGQREFDQFQAGGSVTELAPLPLMAVIKLLGLDVKDVNFYSKFYKGVDIFTKGNIVYDNAVASITLGLGVKTFDGDGLRYEIQEFASMIVNKRLSSYRLRRRESIAIAGIVEKFLNNENVKELK